MADIPTFRDAIEPPADWTTVRLKGVNMRACQMNSAFRVRGQTGRSGDWVVVGPNSVPILVQAERFERLYEPVPEEQPIVATPMAPEAPRPVLSHVDLKILGEMIAAAVREEMGGFIMALHDLLPPPASTKTQPEGFLAGMTPATPAPAPARPRAAEGPLRRPSPPPIVAPELPPVPPVPEEPPAPMVEPDNAARLAKAAAVDEIEPFLALSTIKKRNSVIHPTELYRAYVAHCARKGLAPIIQTTFSGYVKGLGWKREWDHNQHVWSNRELVDAVAGDAAKPAEGEGEPQVGEVGPHADLSTEPPPPLDAPPVSEEELADLGSHDDDGTPGQNPPV
jgi:hypothetical protein